MALAKNFQFPGFVSFFGGILVLIRRNLAFKEITDKKPPNKSVELCGLRITNANPIFNIFICYRAPSWSCPGSEPMENNFLQLEYYR